MLSLVFELHTSITDQKKMESSTDNISGLDVAPPTSAVLKAHEPTMSSNNSGIFI